MSESEIRGGVRVVPDVAFAHPGHSLAVGDYDPNSAT